MLERTIDLQAIQARIEDCASYNFGMRDADQLAHVDAPDLLVALGQAEAERDGLLAMVAKVTVELEDYQNDSDVGDAADYLLTILTSHHSHPLAAHDAQVAAKERAYIIGRLSSSTMVTIAGKGGALEWLREDQA